MAKCQASAKGIPAIAQFPGFHMLRVFLDSMHTVDLGVAPHILGNLIWILVASNKSYPGRTQQRRLEVCYRAYRQFQHDHKINIRRLPFQGGPAVELIIY